MKPTPFIYTTDMERSIAWYHQLIPDATVRSMSQWWSELDIDGMTLAFHAASEVDETADAGLSFTSSEPLETVLTRLEAAGVEPVRGIQDEPFGRSMVLRDPEGFEFQVNQYR